MERSAWVAPCQADSKNSWDMLEGGWGESKRVNGNYAKNSVRLFSFLQKQSVGERKPAELVLAKTLPDTSNDIQRGGQSKD